jgi:hypothetical protein
MINTKEYKRLTRDFRKGNAFNAYEHYMHRDDKVPEEYRGRVESAKWLANTWKEMSEVERAKFEGVKGQLQSRGSGDYRDYTAVSKKIIRRLTWTRPFLNLLESNAMGFVIDERWHRGTRFYGATDGLAVDRIIPRTRNQQSLYPRTTARQLHRAICVGDLARCNQLLEPPVGQFTEFTFKHTKGSFERLNSFNYPTWKLNCRYMYLLLAVDSWGIVTGEEIAPIVPNDGNPLQIGVATRLLKKFKQRKQEATVIIYNSCGVSVQAHINRTDNPKEMWDILARILDTASHTIGRQSLFRDFMGLKPTLRESIDSWFVKLVDIRNRLLDTPEAIGDMTFKTHILCVGSV